MSKYLVTFKDKRTGDIKSQITVEVDQAKVDRSTSFICLKALSDLRKQGKEVPNKNRTSWFWKEVS